MSDTNSNGTVSEGRNNAGRFTAGNRSGGRTKGSRNKLSEAFLQDLHRTWLRHGKKVLEKVAESAPETFLRVCATILPKALEVDNVLTVTTHSELAIEVRDFREAYERWGQVIGANMPMLEARVVEEDDTEPDEH
jgi:hypothetical protein